MKKFIFLDRDGVINVDYGYVHKWKDFKFIDGVILALQNLIELNYKIILVTNQSGIGRGFYSQEDYYILTKKYVNHLKKYKVKFLDIYHCPHAPNAIGEPICSCRKPLPGMFIKASREHKIKLSDAIMIGDKISDIKSAKSAGIEKRYLITNDDISMLESKNLITGSFKSLIEFTNFLRLSND